MTRGDARHDSGRETSFGRRLRMGAAGTIAIGGAIFLGGAAAGDRVSPTAASVTASSVLHRWSAIGDPRR